MAPHLQRTFRRTGDCGCRGRNKLSRGNDAAVLFLIRGLRFRKGAIKLQAPGTPARARIVPEPQLSRAINAAFSYGGRCGDRLLASASPFSSGRSKYGTSISLIIKSLGGFRASPEYEPRVRTLAI